MVGAGILFKRLSIYYPYHIDSLNTIKERKRVYAVPMIFFLFSLEYGY